MSDQEIERFRLVLEGNLGVPFTEGNQVTVLRNGKRIFPPMLAAIRGARTSIEFLTFIYWTGDIADQFSEALAERASAGVQVRVLLDAFGAKPIKESVLARMREAGVDVRWFRPQIRWQIWKADNRTHRKVLLCDGHVGFTGGVGIAAEWDGDVRNPQEWRETHLELRGPAVHGLRAAFLANWAATGRPGAAPAAEIPAIEASGSVPVQVVRATGADAWNDIATLMHAAIHHARRRLRVSTPYFVPDSRTMDLLCAAVERGVTVQILLPGPYHDQRVSQLAGEADFARLLDAGVEIWRYQRSMLHAKVLTADGVLAFVGSANMNQRSMRKDDEINLAMLNVEIVAELDRDFEQDLALSQQVSENGWQRRSRWQRLLETLSQFVRPQT